jgi:riboflavin kinase/FMN adenylyltransferase
LRTLIGLDALVAPERGSSVAIGTFDGVHVGHRALIARMLRDATERGVTSAVLTWDRHPSVTLRPGSEPPLLTTLERKVELIGSLGVELVAVLGFDEELARWPPERFAHDVLARRLGARSVWVGEGWRFGHRAAGDVALLQTLGSRLGFEAYGLGLTDVAGGPASSSRARAAVASGDLELARALLGRPFDIQGRVVPGDRRGRALGYPTANLLIEDELVYPPLGVYAGESVVDGRRHKAAINVGTNPTFGDSAAPRIEVYLLDFDTDIYGRMLRVAFFRRLRDERRFDSVAELAAQMARDVREARASS